MATSAWTNFLENKNDPYSAFKDHISYRLEEFVASITSTLLKSEEEYTTESAKIAAINLIMEQMVILQRQHANLSQQVMVLSLYNDLPELEEAKLKTVTAIVNVVEKNIKKRTLLERVKFLFKI